MQPDHFEQLKQILGDAPRNHDFLAEYVRELELLRQEEETFIRLAFQNVSIGGAYSGADFLGTSVVSELYEPLEAERKLKIRRWWHDRVRTEADQFEDLKARTSSI